MATIANLVQKLKSKDKKVRMRASRKLEDIGKPAVKSLRDGNHSVRHAAWSSLTKITGQDIQRDYDKWKQWYEKDRDK